VLNLSDLQSISRGQSEYSSVAVRTVLTENPAVSWVLERARKLLFSHNSVQITSSYSTFSIVVLFLGWGIFCYRK